MCATPDPLSVAEAAKVNVPFKICPVASPESTAWLGGVVSTENEAESVPKLPARSCTEALMECCPSARGAAGVNCIETGLAVGKTACPSLLRAAVVEATPQSASLRESTTVGRALLVYPPAVGVLSTSTGGIVSGDENVLVNAAVCKFPPKDAAPFTVTL